MESFAKYFGLIEAALTLGGMSLFVWWQFRVLKRDKAARIAREKAQADATNNAKH